jgi:hypothetical protein
MCCFFRVVSTNLVINSKQIKYLLVCCLFCCFLCLCLFIRFKLTFLSFFFLICFSLRHNVIKAGLRKINTSYSRISFSDICKKLHLDSVEDAQFIVAKTIRDGVIDATINYEGQYLQSRETSDVYATEEPQIAFNRRIDFCLKIHNDAVKVCFVIYLFI